VVVVRRLEIDPVEHPRAIVRSVGIAQSQGRPHQDPPLDRRGPEERPIGRVPGLDRSRSGRWSTGNGHREGGQEKAPDHGIDPPLAELGVIGHHTKVT
jgi:hypothetical protein